MKRALIFLVAMSLVACGSGGGDEDIITGLDIRYDGSGETDSILPDIDGDVPFRPDTGDCEPATSQYGFLDLCDGTVKDTNTGLIWEKGYGEPAGTQPNDIKRYCNVLKLGYNGGSLFEDWRTPTIDELRTLILGCDKMALGGECAILHDCSTESCLGVDPNLAPNCKCSNNSGPVFFPDDDPNDEFETWCYLDDSFVPWCNLYYSQTIVPKGTADHERIMYVTFFNGKVGTVQPTQPNAAAYVKCVRGNSSPQIPCVTTTSDNTPGCSLE